MPSDLESHLDLRGYLTRPELLSEGYSDDDIRKLKRHLRLHTIGPGLYAAASYTSLSAEQQHLVRCRASASRFGESIAISHQSAALIHGAAIWAQDLQYVHATRRDLGRGRHQAGVAHHPAELPDSEVTEVDGMIVTSPARTVWDLCVSSGIEAGLVTADSMLNLGLALDSDLLDLSSRYSSWRGSRRAKVTLSFASGLSDSPGETRARLLFRRAGVPRPVLQYRVEDDAGRLIGISDFAWPEFRLLGEFDGMVKYGRPEDLAKEKVREDRLRAQGWSIIRFVWTDLASTQVRTTAARLDEALRQARRVHAWRVSSTQNAGGFTL